jgi:hypothetical protein
MKNKLYFSPANAKTKLITDYMKIEKGEIFSFSLPAGHSCPFAVACKSSADKNTGKITDGENCEFRCFASTMEARSKNLRKNVHHNFSLVKNSPDVVKLIEQSIPEKTKIVRVHVSGDFFTEQYFLDWLTVAKNNPDIIFYGYTKAVIYLKKYENELPSNFIFTASLGGVYDNLAIEMKHSRVVFSENEALEYGLEIDNNEEHALLTNKPFALLVHGTQPAGSKASKALSELKKSGHTGYH